MLKRARSSGSISMQHTRHVLKTCERQVSGLAHILLEQLLPGARQLDPELEGLTRGD